MIGNSSSKVFETTALPVISSATSDKDLEFRGLLLKAIRVQREGTFETGRSELSLDKKYNTQQLLKLARSASLPEITVMLHASRESGKWDWHLPRPATPRRGQN